MPRSAAGPRRDMRRGEIVAAARRLIAEHGLEGLTIASLERKLAFTRGVVTYHFRDKDDIVMAVLDSAVSDITAATRAAIERSATPQDQLRAGLRAVLEGFLEQVEATRVLLSFWGRLATDARIRERNASLYAAYRRQSARLLREGIAAGAFRAVDVDAFSALMVGVILGLVTQAHFAPGAVDPQAALDEAVEIMLARLQKNPDSKRRGS